MKSETASFGKTLKSKALSKTSILLYATILLFIIFAVSTNGFFTPRNFFTILRSMCIITVLGLGISFVITAGEIDLSIGTLPALCGAIMAVLLKSGANVILAILAALMIAIVVGTINGVIISQAKLPSIIITLATYMICQGFAYIVTNQAPVVVSNEAFLNVFGSNINGFPVIVLWMAGLAVVCYFLMHRTRYGKNLAFTGDNRIAALFAGINVNMTLVTSFIICAIFSFLAGMLGVAQTSNASPTMITSDMMTAIAATLIGGTSLSGGEGNIPGTLIGAFFLMMIANGILILGIDQWVLYLINGMIILFTLTIRHYSKNGS